MGNIMGKIAGIPCFQDGKVETLHLWTQEHDLRSQSSWFYSDSHNDLPLLKEVGHAVVMDADEKLLDYAKPYGYMTSLCAKYFFITAT